MDKVVIITGATQGIGLATAKLLAAKGAKTVLVARSEEDLQEVSKSIPNSFCCHADMRKYDEVECMVQKAYAHFGRVDILINNAAQGLNASIETIDVENYQAILELNVIGPLIAMQQVIPLMRKQGGGQIINVSSDSSKNHWPYLGAYASTKCALNCLSLTARTELEDEGIYVGVVYPRLTATNFGKNAMIDDVTKEKTKEFFRSMSEPETPEFVAEHILAAIESKDAELSIPRP